MLQAWGDGQDYLTADAMIFAMNRRERLRAHNAALEAARRAEVEETPVRIAMQHVPKIAALARGVLLAAIAAAAFSWAVL